MKVALVSSRIDPAGVNISNHIRQLLDSGGTGETPARETAYEFHEVDGRLIHAEGVDADFDCDCVIFLSRHASVNPVPVLTVHVTGNFNAAELGGTPRTFVPAEPGMMQAVLRSLARHCPEGYRVSYEVTHHGPTGITHPSFFVEIGSTEKEWSDPAAGRAVAESLLSATISQPVPLIGFGGTHYAVRQSDIALKTRGAFGHIAHTREVAGLDFGMLEGMMQATRAVAAYIDRKSIQKNDYDRLCVMLDTLKIPRLSESEITAMGSLAWETYNIVRRMAEEVIPGARSYVHDLQGEGTLVSFEINPELLAETAKSDEPGLVRELDRLPLIHLSTRDNRLLPVFLTFEKHLPQIINDLNTLCVKIIRNNEITVTESDFLIIKKVRFDPDKARTIGIPEGPAFRQLAAGRTVDVNGQEVTPDLVSTYSDTRIHIPGLEKFL